MSKLKDYLIQDIRNVDKYLYKINRGGLSDFPPAIITCAITGANHGKEANINLPELPEEQAQQTYDAYNAGASMVHIHRRSSKNPAIMTDSAEEYREVNAMIRAKCPDIIVNNTCGGGRYRFHNGFTSPPSLISLPACPEVATIDTSGIVTRTIQRKRPAPLTGRDEDTFFECAYSITPTEADECVAMMDKYGAKPEFECFDIGDLLYLRSMAASGKVKGPFLVDILLHPGTCFNTVDYLLTAMKYVPDNSVVTVLAIGAAQFPLLATALALGLNVRVGMEDNYYIAKGQKAESNAQLVEKIVRIANELGRPVATPAQAREMMGLGAPRQY